MTNDELISKINIFTRFQNDCADLFTEIAESLKGDNTRLARVCADQFNFMAERSNTLIELIKINAIWDAQILARPIIESCIKVCFICYAPGDRSSDLCAEYEETFSVINTLKQHDKASKTMESLGEGVSCLNIFILSSDQLQELKAKVPKEVRNAIESKWGFTRMVAALDKSFKSQFQINPCAGLLHSYALSSHLIHADEMGLGTMRARSKLEGERHSLVTDSHILALLDTVAGAAMVSAVALSFASENDSHRERAIELTTLLKRVHQGTY
ncbi:DUF5677 domain-containing protein [Pseudoduganella lutea]|uniref:Uncharacterized protein n=1 Tax=Pseudoduganella lutea TaxID=321985 RepID=A0A4P6KXS2_9BURK|nr:DUF5677 domain-containing protein [Pseudoduganella lutea]QBE63362.1 hypothetical protein EWM63_10635 [Pseudoduganella lutea]